MTSRWSRYIGAIAFCSLLMGLLSCARDQELISIAIQPSTEMFGAANIPVSANAGSTVQLRALGSFIHPPVTKDVTTQATWTSNTPDIATVDANGLLTAAGLACGNALISATIKAGPSSGSIVTSNMTANVVCFVGPALTVNFLGNGAGTITSSPAGLSCASTCSTSFPTNTSVVLTASTNGFGGWTGCDSVSGTTCTVTMGSGNRAVTVTFN